MIACGLVGFGPAASLLVMTGRTRAFDPPNYWSNCFLFWYDPVSVWRGCDACAQRADGGCGCGSGWRNSNSGASTKLGRGLSRQSDRRYGFSSDVFQGRHDRSSIQSNGRADCICENSALPLPTSGRKRCGHALVCLAVWPSFLIHNTKGRLLATLWSISMFVSIELEL